MDVSQYFVSLTEELSALKNRVRHYIDDAGWLADGEWKESVLRSILRRHLPNNIGVGRGYVISSVSASTQIDVLLYDKTKPILFQDGEFVIVTPDTAKGAIEVKTRIEQHRLGDALKKICDVAELIHQDALNRPRFFGLFSYEDEPPLNIEYVLETLRSVVGGNEKRLIHCLSFGTLNFIRFWHFHPALPHRPTNKWHAYRLAQKAPAYFVHNVIDHLNPEWANNNNDIWYPAKTKEPDKIAEIALSEEPNV